MPSGDLRLATRGKETLLLTEKPEITHFKVVYKRYSNFAIEPFALDFEEPLNFGLSSGCSLPQNGDMVSRIYLKINLPAIYNQANVLVDSTVQTLTTLATTMFDTFKLYANKIIPWFDESKQLLSIENNTFHNIRNSLDEMMIANDYQDKYSSFVSSLNDFNQFVNTLSEETRDKLNIRGMEGFNESFKSIGVFSELDKSILDKTKVPEIINDLNQISLDTELQTNEKQLLEFQKYITKFIVVLNAYYGRILNTKNYYAKLEKQYNSQYTRSAWAHKIGLAVIDTICLEIGGIEIMCLDSNYLDIYHGLKGMHHNHTYNRMIGNSSYLTEMSETKNEYELYVPLPFWFSESTMIALPLIAMQNSEVRINVKLKELQEVIHHDSHVIPNLYLQGCQLIVDYVYLDTEERDKFTKVPHQYIVEIPETQIFEIANDENKILVNTDNGLVKEFFWFIQDQTFMQDNKFYFNYCLYDIYKNKEGTNDKLGDVKIKDRYFRPQNKALKFSITMNDYSSETFDNTYFEIITGLNRRKQYVDGVFYNTYSLFPNDFQPSGMMNFQKIDNLTIGMNSPLSQNTILKLYCIHYKVLTVYNGKAFITS